MGTAVTELIQKLRNVAKSRMMQMKYGMGLGGRLLKEGIKEIKEKLHPKRICIEAQCHAVGFYEREGFRICSEEY